MYHIAVTPKPFSDVVKSLESAIAKHGFSLLAVHNLNQTLRNNGVEFNEQCKIFEICNPQRTAEALNSDMRLNMALPCRISIYTEKGETNIGVLSPTDMLAALSDDAGLMNTASEAEGAILAMVDQVLGVESQLTVS